MKNYIGVKIVKAEPMTKGAFEKKERRSVSGIGEGRHGRIYCEISGRLCIMESEGNL